jgi:hypothetical protein
MAKTKAAEITDTQRLDWLLEREVEGDKLESGAFFIEWREESELRFANGSTLRECIDNAIRGLYISGRAA